ncbi:FAD-dependent monooxygenase [Deinococcus sp. HMF7604]|uniref:FAD-dependent oxidoreductase n=1 Tax=Deinococcus betulae TaxID=2873312 RepID=UPI001CD01647|nr:FAD-dependent oxidoreductase [Deinococcus betulae]MBZ9751537.1 FAD-dependent monooxygenase [Deinococcus betulae]
MTPRYVLIAGASIAGPALAYWLHRYGWDVTVVERAPTLRTGGHNVDLRGPGREVIRRMGLEAAVRAASTGEVGTRFIGQDGQVVAEFPVRPGDDDSATAELEILRGDLAQLLYDATAQDVTYRFGDRIQALHDEGQQVAVTFEHGPAQTFDLVVAADGLHSKTRHLMFGDEPQVKPVGQTMLFLTIPRQASDVNWWQWYTTTHGRAVHLRPDRYGTIRALLSYTSGKANAPHPSEEEQQHLFQQKFRDAGWEANRVLDGLQQADDWYFDVLAQVKAPRWSQGRRAMVGDAAYCASPISGMGTSLALTGAYVLAGEVAAHVDVRDGLKAYERLMRPYVEQAQRLPPGTPRLANPETRLGVAAWHGLIRVLAAAPKGWLGC